MSCDLVVRCIKWIPVLFISIILGWSYYSYVYQLCFLIVESWVEKIFLLLFYHASFIMLLWAYYQTIFTDIARVPHQFKISNAEMEQIMMAKNQDEQIRILKTLSKDLPLLNVTLTNCVRFCDKCQLIKPDSSIYLLILSLYTFFNRSHHCSVCGVCVLKFDHHCPWVNNCVNYSNYKYFLLFLMYGLWYCIYVVVTLLSYFIKFWKGELQGLGRFHLLFLFVIAVMFAFSLVSLFGYHIYLVLKNRTTLEAFRCPVFNNDDGNGGPDKNGFFLTYSDNFQQVFGVDKRKWFLPVDTSLGDGIRYPVHRQNLIETC